MYLVIVFISLLSYFIRKADWHNFKNGNVWGNRHIHVSSQLSTIYFHQLYIDVIHLLSPATHPLPHTHTHTHIQTHKKIRGAFTSLIFMKAECYYSFLLICSHLLKKFLMENFIFVQRIAFSQISPTRKFHKSWTTTFLV